MKQKNTLLNNTVVTISIFLISLAISIIIPYILKISFWPITPAIGLLIMGFWTLLVSFSIQKIPQPKIQFGPGEYVYLLSWGSIMLISGILLVIQWIFPKENPIILIAIFILLVGTISLISSIKHTQRSE